MRIETGRSSWLRRIDWRWMSVEGGYEAPCLYQNWPDEKCTLVQFDLTIEPYGIPDDEIDSWTDESYYVEDYWPEFLRKGLDIEGLNVIWPTIDRQRLTCVRIQIKTPGRVRDFNRFRDSIVSKLLKNA